MNIKNVMKLFRYIPFCIASVLATAACNEEQKEPMGPEAVVEAFSRAVAAGDFETARTLCDTIGMKDYLENYQKTMDAMQKVDSSALAIAKSMLSGAVFEATKVDKDGEKRTVRYTVRTEGETKSKKATVRKEEGEWKVEAITDVI